mmetsp:Transcript_1615/g.1963  ORF Transcript_1615/g.1963 Transcript_1615/m.1963 type:complete len:211 (-) Transcript_1615:55-687(-)
MTVPFHFVPGVKTDSGIRISNGIFRMICCSFLIRFSTSRMNNTMRLFLSKLVSFRSVGSSLETVYFCFARRLLGFKFDHLEFLFSPLLLLEGVTSAGLSSSSSSCSKEILSSLNSTKSFLPRLIFFVDSEVSSSPSSSSLSKEIESITSSLFCSAILSSSISVVDSEEERKSALLLLCCFVLHNKSATSGGGGGENDNDNLHNNDENKNT